VAYHELHAILSIVPGQEKGPKPASTLRSTCHNHVVPRISKMPVAKGPTPQATDKVHWQQQEEPPTHRFATWAGLATYVAKLDSSSLQFRT
jgi:hypothetical protein